MKKLFFTILVSAIVFASYAQQQSQRYAIKSGYAKFELSGNTEGTVEFWWDDYGDKICELEKSTSTVTIMGISDVKKIHKLSVLNKANNYVVDYIKNEGYQSIVPYSSGKAIANSLTEAEQKQLADDLLNAMGGQKLGTEKVLGYSCEMISLMGTKSWIYKGLILKSEAKLMGVYNKKEVSIFKPKQTVPSSKFEKPSGVHFVNNNQVQQEQSGDFFGALSSAMEEEEEETPNDLVPTRYPYDKFSEKINNFSYNGYTKFMLNSLGGVHTAMFMQGFSKSILVTATSKKNSEQQDMSGVEKFTYSGKTCYYGKDTDEDGKPTSFLIIDIKAYDTYILIAASPTNSKSEMLNIAKALKF